MGYSIVDVAEVTPSGPGGMVRFVRRELGCEAFGLNWFELGANAEGLGHDEAESGQEEVYIVISGSGHWHVDADDGDVDIPVHVGSVLRFDPETPRLPVAGPDGLSFVAIGANRGAYTARGPF